MLSRPGWGYPVAGAFCFCPRGAAHHSCKNLADWISLMTFGFPHEDCQIPHESNDYPSMPDVGNPVSRRRGHARGGARRRISLEYAARGTRMSAHSASVSVRPAAAEPSRRHARIAGTHRRCACAAAPRPTAGSGTSAPISSWISAISLLSVLSMALSLRRWLTPSFIDLSIARRSADGSSTPCWSIARTTAVTAAIRCNCVSITAVASFCSDRARIASNLPPNDFKYSPAERRAIVCAECKRKPGE